MSTKFGFAGGIPERKVKPIWDSVDSRQFKQALKLSNTLLSKYPNFPYALALKALILERMGKLEEALPICLNSKEQLQSNDSVYIDELTLSTLQIVFHRLDQLKLATSCYEYACAKDKHSKNLELLTGLFNCYVNEYSFFKQQKTAMKLYKIMNEERFVLWAVCSIQLQVLFGNGEDKLLQLAEALIKRHITLYGLHKTEAVLTYISILEQQRKYTAALDVLSGDLGSLITIEVDKLRLQGKLLTQLGDFAAAADIFQKILVSCPDDWESFLHYLDCLFEIDTYCNDSSESDQIHLREDFKAHKLSQLTSDTFDSCISTASVFVKRLEADNDSLRCPYLANIEIEKYCCMYSKTDNTKFVEAIYKYFCRFYYLGCFTSDVKVFLRKLNHNEKLELLSRFMNLPELSSVTPLRRLSHSITVFKLQDSLGIIFMLSTTELKGVAVRMVELFNKNLYLSKDLEPQVNIHGEELLSMAANILVQLFWRTNNLGYLLEAIMILEFGLTIRSFTSRYKILLVHLYSLLTAFPLAYEWYMTLQIKNILLETVSHHILPQMLNSPMWSNVSDILKNYLDFMDNYKREAADHTNLAFRHSNYSKVIESVELKNKLQQSHQYLIAKVEASLLQLKQKANSFDQVASILENLDSGKQVLQLADVECESLTFNYDFQSRPWWTPAVDVNYLLGPFDVNLVLSQESLENHNLDDKKKAAMASVKKRSLIPRLLCLSIQAASCSPRIASPSTASNNIEISSEFKLLLENYSVILGCSFDEAVSSITNISYSEDCSSLKVFGSDMVYWMNFAIFFFAWNIYLRGAGIVSDEDISCTFNIVDNLLKNCIKKQLSSAQPLLASPGSNLPLLTQVISESFSWYLLIIQSHFRSITIPIGKKKKKNGQMNQELSLLSKIIQCTIPSLKCVILDIKSWTQEQINRPVDQSLDFIVCRLHEEGEEDGPGKVLRILEQSLHISKSEIGDLTEKALESWNSIDVATKFIDGQRIVLFELSNICESKLKLLDSMKFSS